MSQHEGCNIGHSIFANFEVGCALRLDAGQRSKSMLQVNYVLHVENACVHVECMQAMIVCCCSLVRVSRAPFIK